MNIIYEILNGTIPSHPIRFTIDVRSQDATILTIHQLNFKGTHARRMSLQQEITGSYVVIFQDEGQLVLNLNIDSWTESLVFRIVNVHANIEKPTLENARPRDVGSSSDSSSSSLVSYGELSN